MEARRAPLLAASGFGSISAFHSFKPGHQPINILPQIFHRRIVRMRPHSPLHPLKRVEEKIGDFRCRAMIHAVWEPEGKEYFGDPPSCAERGLSRKKWMRTFPAPVVHRLASTSSVSFRPKPRKQASFHSPLLQSPSLRPLIPASPKGFPQLLSCPNCEKLEPSIPCCTHRELDRLNSIDYAGGPVSSLDETPFVRRVSANGTIHSICTQCFLTVALGTREADLDEGERRHVCDTWLLAHWKELASREPADGWDQKPPRR